LENYLPSQSRTSPTSVEIELVLTSVDEHTNAFKNRIEYCTLIETEIKLLEIGVLSEVTHTCTAISHFKCNVLSVWPQEIEIFKVYLS
jgi:hypothetical protein